MAIAAQTDYELGQDNIQLLGLDIHNPVFVVSSLTIVAFVAGIGIGLMFFGVAEPVDHFLNPLLGGGLVALQAAALATGFPFALVLVAMCYSTWKGLRAARGANP